MENKWTYYGLKNQSEKLLIQESLNQLSSQDRQILVLYYWWGYRDSDIGKIIGISQQLANYRRNKAIKHFKNIFLNQLHEPD